MPRPRENLPNRAGLDDPTAVWPQDRELVPAGRLVVRWARPGEKVLTLDGQTRELNPRIGAGLRYVSAALPELPYGLLQAAAVEDRVSVDAGELVAVRSSRTITISPPLRSSPPEATNPSTDLENSVPWIASPLSTATVFTPLV